MTGARTALALQLQYQQEEKEIPVLFRQCLSMTNASMSSIEGFISVVQSSDKPWKLFFEV